MKACMLVSGILASVALFLLVVSFAAALARSSKLRDEAAIEAQRAAEGDRQTLQGMAPHWRRSS